MATIADSPSNNDAYLCQNPSKCSNQLDSNPIPCTHCNNLLCDVHIKEHYRHSLVNGYKLQLEKEKQWLEANACTSLAIKIIFLQHIGTVEILICNYLQQAIITADQFEDVEKRYRICYTAMAELKKLVNTKQSFDYHIQTSPVKVDETKVLFREKSLNEIPGKGSLEKYETSSYASSQSQTKEQINYDAIKPAKTAKEKYDKTYGSLIESIRKNLAVSSIHTPAVMAAAGLQYTGVDDRSKCANCGLEISNWTREMIPFDEHRKRSPTCPYVKEMTQNPFTITSKVQFSLFNITH
ncbi:unnamed protein product [Didymodactylos carnosus]|uniref:Uncharacterized protein n=1 Tax=Didymodactylos carnosus TaxID=1234261 RepID=A0A813RDQ6_9BILA|nr:unnamed protein product [Didymodactylos carnosus]CAF3563841.1 unnamed protein product [Didymodactylos carnosus]